MRQIDWDLIMSELLPIAVSAFVVIVLVLLIARKFKLSSRYERAPRAVSYTHLRAHETDS